MVCDEGSLLNQQDVIKSLVDGGWPVVVPSSGSFMRKFNGDVRFRN
jgi:hypothetical protein